jgi:hypothetical protein
MLPIRNHVRNGSRKNSARPIGIGSQQAQLRSLDEARFPHNRKIAWLTRRCAGEYAGFLEWLWRADEAPCEVVDLTNVRLSNSIDPPRPPDLAMTLAMLHPDTIRSNRLWDLAEPLEPNTRK